MTSTQLKTHIQTYPTRRAFIAEFNKMVGDDLLDEVTLSRQLSDDDDQRIKISRAWMAAYGLFFKVKDHNKHCHTLNRIS